MKLNNVYFLKSCAKASQFPEFPYPEFAFFGRSNVGKSSLINMILNRKNLVKTGSKPGVTKLINFFIVDDNTSFVDLPGFGYAKLPENIRKQFMPMLKGYINSRENLKLAFMLIDIRRVPGDYEEEILSALMEKGIATMIILTKSDKLSKTNRKKNMQKIVKKLQIGEDNILYTSSETREGRKEILQVIDDFRK